MPPPTPLPLPPPVFTEKKTRILQQLSLPLDEYTDASPKGSVDAAIRHVIDEVNNADGFVTTSSCAGRVSVFLEGKRSRAVDGDGADERLVDGDGQSSQMAGVGGKGAGGTWLYVSHEAMGTRDVHSWVEALQFTETATGSRRPFSSEQSPQRRLVQLKFEPMILHVLAASLAHAQLLLTCALQAGFRESGAVNLVQAQQPPIVVVRSTGLAFASLIGYETFEGARIQLVSDEYLEMLATIVDERFAENTKRIERFRLALQSALAGARPKLNPDGREWEDMAARRLRMRDQGLRRKAALESKRCIAETSDASINLDGDDAEQVDTTCHGSTSACT
ncbi:hypothetical protein CDD81_1492 [Ophiocordyceps australis]|uniref:tRNA(Phe) 7-[(3-amino-3-carboxypropyl)-4-demethylwyosine(37)-N(4)]-methyltransferase n=1 Tax=Ophiocordyceps australis TaxID=1399860 RepID=A0A2C5Y8F3_9HYPO|nr:hypothetical protein CDD81_1492 [Ophiocordyceps australis]